MACDRHSHCWKLHRRINLLRHWPHRQVGVDRKTWRETRDSRAAQGEGRPLGCVAGTPVVGTFRGRYLCRSTRLLPHQIPPLGRIYADRQGRPIHNVVWIVATGTTIKRGCTRQDAMYSPNCFCKGHYGNSMMA